MAKRYESYKDSGVQWLGEIPEHWGCVRLKHTGATRNGLTYSPSDEVSSDNGILVLRSSNIQDGKLSFLDNVYVRKDFDNSLYMKKDDILICSRNGSRDLVGKLVRIPEDMDCTFGAFMMVYRTNGWAPFMTYCLQIVISSYKNLFSTSTINQLVKSKFDNFRTPLPPLSEQQAIVSYLDNKCGKIDEWLDKKQKEVEHLQELKQRVIADAVTRGLNPDAKTKATNIPWLPEIPEHWEIHRAKHMFCKEQRPVQEGDEIVTCFRDGEVTLRKNRRLSGFTEATDYSHYQHICEGDLVIHQMDAFAGAAGVSDSNGMGTPVLSVCTPKMKCIDNKYYAHIVRLMGKNGYILSLYRGIRERSSDFRFETFAKLWLPVPPLSEQKQIVSYITEKTTKIDTLVANINKEIENIKEYKQRLISDVVTGQIKVY